MKRGRLILAAVVVWMMAGVTLVMLLVQANANAQKAERTTPYGTLAVPYAPSGNHATVHVFETPTACVYVLDGAGGGIAAVPRTGGERCQ